VPEAKHDPSIAPPQRIPSFAKWLPSLIGSTLFADYLIGLKRDILANDWYVTSCEAQEG